MFPSVLQELRSYFGRDFVLGVFFPVMTFLGASLALYLEVKQGLLAALALWAGLSLLSQIFSVLGGLILCVVLSYFLYNFQYSITRLFEGYWPRIRILKALRDWRVRLYERRGEYLGILAQSASTSAEGSAIMAERLTYYPPPTKTHRDKFMPTRIGNILRASEIYAYDRYAIDSVIIWTRLRPVLANVVVAPLAESETARNFMLLTSAFAVTFTLFWCPVLAFFTHRWDLFLLCSLGWPLAWICYNNAVQSTLAFSEQLKAVFDLHRFDLLKALNRRIPDDLEKEYEEWENLSLFFLGGHELSPAPPEPENIQSLDQVVTALADYLKKIDSPKQ